MSKTKPPIVVSLRRITKNYFLHHEKPTFIERVFDFGKQDKFTAVCDVSLDIRRGDRVGIIGLNGSGKTTLLKIIANITQPTSGTIKSNGRVVSLIDLEAGFHPDLSGINNITLNGLLLGMSRQEIKEQIEDIISFSGLGDFINAPFYTYSQGMKLRLGFSVAIHSRPDVLLIDEGYAVGDKDFKIKAKKRLKQMLKKSLTLVIVSQVPSFIDEYASTVILMEKGRIKSVGDRHISQTFFFGDSIK